MSVIKHSHKAEKGVALILVILMLLVLSTLAALLAFVVSTEGWSTSNYRQLTQARYVAEAGAQRTVNWLMYSYTPPANTTGYDLTKYPVQYNSHPVVLSAMSGVNANYSDSTVQAAFNSALNGQTVAGLSNATYSTTAELLATRPVTLAFVASSGTQALQKWQITSQGKVAGVRNATVQVVETIERTGSPLFNYGVFATGATCNAITFSGGSFTDSFNSSQGSYAATVQQSQGDIGTNGNMNMSGGASKVNGTLSSPMSGTGSCSSGAPTALTASGGAGVTSGVLTLSASVTFQNPPAPNPAPPITSQNMSGSCGGIAGCTNVGPKTVALAPGAYGNLNASGGTNIQFSTGTYSINSLTLSGGSSLVINSGPVVMQIAGAGSSTPIDFSGGSIANGAGNAANVQIVYGGTGKVNLSGGSGNYAVVYAPNAPITMSGGSDWYGALIGSTFVDSGGTAIHYDLALQSNFVTAGKYTLVGFSWSKF